VQSLVTVPIRVAAPIGAIGCYWAQPHLASTREIKLLQALADSASIAVENAQLYSELKKKIEESRRAVRARDEFLSVASHELRTPLTALKLQLQVLTELLRRQPGGGDPLLLERLSRAISSNQRLAALVEALLDVSRVSLGRLALDLQNFDLQELTREVVERFADQAQQAGCHITLRPCAPLVGRWDRGRMDQVLTNLLANAIKYGAGKPIELRLAARPTTAILTVKDEGIGISSEHLPLIFERFSRAASPRHYGGLGLGLYLSRQIVEAHGGTIRVQSRPGQGARFRVELPWAAPGTGRPRVDHAP
jgi:signal transduction histidine kinase